MQEIFEKLIETLHKEARLLYSLDSFTPVGAWKREDAIEVVKQVVSEYNNGWIPCSEKQPKDGQKIYASVVYQGGEKEVKDSLYKQGHYMVNERCDIDRVIVAWMPRIVPEPYKLQED